MAHSEVCGNQSSQYHKNRLYITAPRLSLSANTLVKYDIMMKAIWSSSSDFKSWRTVSSLQYFCTLARACKIKIVALFSGARHILLSRLIDAIPQTGPRSFRHLPVFLNANCIINFHVNKSPPASAPEARRRSATSIAMVKSRRAPSWTGVKGFPPVKFNMPDLVWPWPSFTPAKRQQDYCQ